MRRILFPLAVVAVTVLLGLLLTYEDEPEEPEVVAPEEPPDFFLTGFRMDLFDEAGEHRARLRGERAERFPGRGELEITGPDIELQAQDGTAWHAEAPYGLGRQAEQTLRLYEPVTIRRPPQGERPALAVRTRNVLIDFPAGEARTRARVTAEDPFGTVQGVGMTLDYRAERLRLHAEAEGIYELQE